MTYFLTLLVIVLLVGALNVGALLEILPQSLQVGVELQRQLSVIQISVGQPRIADKTAPAKDDPGSGRSFDEAS